MTKQECIDEVIRLTRYDSNEPSPTEAVKLLDSACAECSFFTRVFLEHNTQAVPPNTRVVQVDGFGVEAVYWNDERLEHTGNEVWLQIPDASAPAPFFYFLTENRILLFPTPTQTGTLKYRYHKYHPKLDSLQPTDPLLFPEHLHRSVTLYAAGLWLDAMLGYNPGNRGQALKKAAIELWQVQRQEVEKNRIIKQRKPVSGIQTLTLQLVEPHRPQIQQYEIENAILHAIYQFFVLTEYGIRGITWQVPANARFFRIPQTDHVLAIRELYRQDGDQYVRLMHQKPKEADLFGTLWNRRGTPTHYVFYGTIIEFFPVPEEPITVHANVVALPDDPYESIPIFLQESIAKYAAGTLLAGYNLQLASALKQESVLSWNRYANLRAHEQLRSDDWKDILRERIGFTTIDIDRRGWTD